MIRRAALAGLLLVLAGCALQRTVPGTGVAWDQRREFLQQLPAWQLNGRVAVKTGDQGGQGSLAWTQAADGARIRLSGPFGAGAYEIGWNATEVVVRDGRGEIRAAYTGADAADEFLRRELGWAFPAMSARYWVLGVPAPGSRARERFDAEGWLTAIDQQGWHVAYDGFRRDGEVWLPRKLTLTRGDARVRVVLDRWQPLS